MFNHRFPFFLFQYFIKRNKFKSAKLKVAVFENLLFNSSE